MPSFALRRALLLSIVALVIDAPGRDNSHGQPSCRRQATRWLETTTAWAIGAHNPSEERLSGKIGIQAAREQAVLIFE
jgi:hypothetical protein